MLRVKLTRDSVCMGDDCDAPHFLKLELPETSTIQTLVDTIDARSYLAKVVGFDHQWVLLANNAEAARLKGNDLEVPEKGAVSLSSLALNGVLKVHFKYSSSRT
ncbi:hypothetical protein [Vibrio antiquarius]|uniref:hypothetical protein n=1 Tax=Vibrio antiquarius (strain Ex25) TaxID=150340 RepID=UPI00265A2833|nr:hypothetical protein [Vibrio antiquarius]MCR9608459.1 hypothetical protein [Vibrio alginolyticus]MCR9613499.1 hypothetical protein [Vibrio alginolyticus]MCR9847320.1 hypothetical protein [Vibrio antiquarius]MCR9913041.1 hypothetical protein [Vibrio antiquarius]